VLLISSNMDNRLLTSADDDLLRSGSWLYLVLNILLVVFWKTPGGPRSCSVWRWWMCCCCAACSTPGGVASAIGNLLIVSVAISNTLLRRRIGLLIAAIGALGIVGSGFLLSFSHPCRQ
jgi:two-component system sensor histidine kinase PilS (NtrC family)